MANVKERLLEFLKKEGISNSEFSRRMGLSVAYIASMRKSMPEEKVSRLIEIFPQLNRDWLLYGEGEMYREEQSEREPAEDIEDYMVPLLPVDAFAGRFPMMTDSVDLRSCETVISPVKGVDFAIRVSGDSMEPEIHDGNVIFIRRINDRAFIPWGHPMVLDTENGTLLKVLYPSEKGNGYIEAVSYNEKYPPLQVPTDSIYGIYRIMAELREARIF